MSRDKRPPSVSSRASRKPERHLAVDRESGKSKRLKSERPLIEAELRANQDRLQQLFALAEQAQREREILKRIVEAQEDERRRIARELHDQLGQRLTALRLKLEGLKSNYAAEPAMIKAIDDLQRQAQKIDDDISFLSWELRPTALDTLGLRNALGNFVKEWSRNYGIKAEYHTARARWARLVPEIEINLYRIAQEALNNILKHARASKADVMLEYSKQDVVLVVEDNGAGFVPNKKVRGTNRGRGLGLIGMRERAALLGGVVEIESSRGKGTTVIARVPARFLPADEGVGPRKRK